MIHEACMHKKNCVKIVNNLKVKFHLRKAKWKCCKCSAQAQSDKTI